MKYRFNLERKDRNFPKYIRIHEHYPGEKLGIVRETYSSGAGTKFLDPFAAKPLLDEKL